MNKSMNSIYHHTHEREGQRMPFPASALLTQWNDVLLPILVVS